MHLLSLECIVIMKNQHKYKSLELGDINVSLVDMISWGEGRLSFKYIAQDCIYP